MGGTKPGHVSPALLHSHGSASARLAVAEGLAGAGASAHAHATVPHAEEHAGPSTKRVRIDAAVPAAHISQGWQAQPVVHGRRRSRYQPLSTVEELWDARLLAMSVVHDMEAAQHTPWRLQMGTQRLGAQGAGGMLRLTSVDDSDDDVAGGGPVQRATHAGLLMPVTLRSGGAAGSRTRALEKQAGTSGGAAGSTGAAAGRASAGAVNKAGNAQAPQNDAINTHGPGSREDCNLAQAAGGSNIPGQADAGEGSLGNQEGKEAWGGEWAKEFPPRTRTNKDKRWLRALGLRENSNYDIVSRRQHMGSGYRWVTVNTWSLLKKTSTQRPGEALKVAKRVCGNWGLNDPTACEAMCMEIELPDEPGRLLVRYIGEHNHQPFQAQAVKQQVDRAVSVAGDESLALLEALSGAYSACKLGLGCGTTTEHGQPQQQQPAHAADYYSLAPASRTEVLAALDAAGAVCTARTPEAVVCRARVGAELQQAAHMDSWQGSLDESLVARVRSAVASLGPYAASVEAVCAALVAGSSRAAHAPVAQPSVERVAAALLLVLKQRASQRAGSAFAAAAGGSHAPGAKQQAYRTEVGQGACGNDGSCPLLALSALTASITRSLGARYDLAGQAGGQVQVAELQTQVGGERPLPYSLEERVRQAMQHAAEGGSEVVAQLAGQLLQPPVPLPKQSQAKHAHALAAAACAADPSLAPLLGLDKPPTAAEPCGNKVGGGVGQGAEGGAATEPAGAVSAGGAGAPALGGFPSWAPEWRIPSAFLLGTGHGDAAIKVPNPAGSVKKRRRKSANGISATGLGMGQAEPGGAPAAATYYFGCEQLQSKAAVAEAAAAAKLIELARTQRIGHVSRVDQAASLAPHRLLPIRPLLASDPLASLPDQMDDAIAAGSAGPTPQYRPTALRTPLLAASLADIQDYSLLARSAVGSTDATDAHQDQRGRSGSVVMGSTVWQVPSSRRQQLAAAGSGERGQEVQGLGEEGASLPPPVHLLYVLAVKLGVQPEVVRSAAGRFSRIAAQHGLSMRHPLGVERERAADTARLHTWRTKPKQKQRRGRQGQGQVEAGEAEEEIGEVTDGEVGGAIDYIGQA